MNYNKKTTATPDSDPQRQPLLILVAVSSIIYFPILSNVLLRLYLSFSFFFFLFSSLPSSTPSFLSIRRHELLAATMRRGFSSHPHLVCAGASSHLVIVQPTRRFWLNQYSVFLLF